MTNSNYKLTKEDFKQINKRSLFTFQLGWNYERMQASGYLYMILPQLRKMYGQVVVSNKPAPEKKEGLFAYFKSSWTEFKKVVWPSRDEAVKMTVFVIIFVAVLAAFIYTADTIISWLFFDVLLNRKG